MILTPGENYREAHLLTEQAADADADGEPGRRDYLLKLAGVHATLAGCDPETHVVAVSAEDLRTLVGAIQENRYGAQTNEAIETAGRVAAQIRYVHGPEIARLAGDYSQRIMTALDLIDHGPSTATAGELLGLVKTALTTPARS